MPIDLKIFYFFNNLAGKFVVFDTVIIFFADYFEYFVVALFLATLFSAPFYKNKLKIFLTAAASVANKASLQ